MYDFYVRNDKKSCKGRINGHGQMETASYMLRITILALHALPIVLCDQKHFAFGIGVMVRNKQFMMDFLRGYKR